MEIPAANIAATAAISLLALKAVSHMTEIQFQAEKRYQVAISMAKALLEKGLLTEEEYAVIDTKLLEKFQPALGTLLSEMRWLNCLSEWCIWLERSDFSWKQ